MTYTLQRALVVFLIFCSFFIISIGMYNRYTGSFSSDIRSRSMFNNGKRYNGIFTLDNDTSNINYDIKKWVHNNINLGFSDDDPIVYQKRMEIRNTFIRAYKDYAQHCYGDDELIPIGNKCHNWIGAGLTILDSLDTMFIMDLRDILDEATTWVNKSLSFNKNNSVSLFEITIRCLGGLMSIYDLTQENLFLNKAKDLVYRLAPAFGTVSGLPLGRINLRSGKAHSASKSGLTVRLAEIGTLQLEFKSYADRKNDLWIGQKAVNVFKKLDPKRGGSPLPLPGLYPVFIDVNTLLYEYLHVTWGAKGDSFYEYLLKYYIYEGKKDERLRNMYIESSEGMLKYLYRRHSITGLYYISEWVEGELNPKMDELACFAGGTLALGVIHQVLDNEEMLKRHTIAAENLGETCYQMFARQGSGLAPETVFFSDFGMKSGADVYILRPETVETFFYLWRLTGKQKWRDYGWAIFQSIEKWCRVDANQGSGYASLLHVSNNPPVQDPRGVMHSFFLAETLKYLYLLFSHPNLIPLDVYIFNTEAHPIRIATTL